MRLAPDEVLVAARVDLDDDASGGDLEMHADEVDRRVRERYPEVQAHLPRPDGRTRSRAGRCSCRCTGRRAGGYGLMHLS